MVSEMIFEQRQYALITFQINWWGTPNVAEVGVRKR
jgi:hypothetical protein